MSNLNGAVNIIEPSPPPIILTIPDEILLRILNLLPYSHQVESFVKCSGNDQRCLVSQVLILRHVCRHFRCISAELDFWSEPHFQFRQLLPDFEDSEGIEWMEESSILRHEQRFLKVLLSDAALVNCMGRRKAEWMFTTLEELQIVIQAIPLFKQNARVIHLEFMEYINLLHSGTSADPLQTAIEILSACSCITTLSIHSPRSVDLTAIASSFPHLEWFTCSETPGFHGSLHQLTRLQTLSIDTCEYRPLRGHSRATTVRPSWLPLQSTETLTQLSLMCDTLVIPFFHAMSQLSPDQFINLKLLNVSPLCSPIVTFILRSQCRLEVFMADLVRHLAPIATVTAMFQAECLRNLKEFAASNSYDEDYKLSATECYWSLFFDAFTFMLPSIEKVYLEVPLHIAGSSCFSRMTKLKVLDWDGSPYPYLGDAKDGENPKEKVISALESAFSGFVEKPVFTVDFIG